MFNQEKRLENNGLDILRPSSSYKIVSLQLRVLISKQYSEGFSRTSAK